MPRHKAAPRSATLRTQIRTAINARVQTLGLNGTATAKAAGLSIAQASRLLNGHDAFSLDRLVDVASNIGLNVEVRAARPYAKGARA